MSNHVKELGTPKPLSASGRLGGPGVTCIGFLCATSSTGTLEITEGEASGGATLVVETPLTAGEFVRIPAHFPKGAYAVLTDATGTFFL